MPDQDDKVTLVHEGVEGAIEVTLEAAPGWKAHGWAEPSKPSSKKGTSNNG